MAQRAQIADRQRQSAAHGMTTADERNESADHIISHGDDVTPQSGASGIGLAAGIPFIIEGTRSAELLELFIESL